VSLFSPTITPFTLIYPNIGARVAELPQ